MGTAGSRMNEVLSSMVTAPAASVGEAKDSPNGELIPPEEKVLTVLTSVLIGKVLMCSM